MKKAKLFLSLLVAFLIIIFPLVINADSSKIDPNAYNSSGPTESEVEEAYKFGGSIAGVIQIVGTAVSIGSLLIIGIRYVLSSADEKAEYKERMIPYFIGAVLLFGASNVIRIIYELIK